MTKKLVSFDDQAEPGQGLPAAVKAELNNTYGLSASTVRMQASGGMAVADRVDTSRSSVPSGVGISGVGTDTTQLASGTRYTGTALLGGAARFMGATVQQVGATDAVQAPTRYGLNPPFVAEFDLVGVSKFEVEVIYSPNGSASSRSCWFEVWDGDRFIGQHAYKYADPAAPKCVLVTLPTAARHRVRVVVRVGPLVAVRAQAGGTVAYPVDPDPQPKITVVSDSFGEGAGASAAPSWVEYVQQGLVWNIDNLSAGGSGYITAGTNAGPLSGRVADVTGTDADVVLVAFGFNDRNADPATVAAAAATAWDEIRTGLPSAQLVIVGPWDSVTGVGALDAALLDKANQAGLPYISPRTEGWMRADPALRSDAIHPNNAGHRIIAARMLGHLRSIVADAATVRWGHLSAEVLAAVGAVAGKTSRTANEVVPGIWRFTTQLNVQSAGTPELLQLNGGNYPAVKVNDANGVTTASMLYIPANGSIYVDLTSSSGGHFRIRSQVGGGTTLFQVGADGKLTVAGPTTTTAPAAGGAGALPASPTGYLTVNIGGADRKIPYY